MTVSVVVPTIGASPELRRAVERKLAAARRTGPDAEVLVVVNGRTSVPALAHVDSPLLRVVFLEKANVARARNVGIALARHDTVLFGDDGATVPLTWCTELADGLRDPRYPVVTARVRVPVTGPITAYLDYQRLFDPPPLDADEAATVTGHCAIRRDRLPAAIRYDEERLPHVGEDVAFGHALRAAGVRIRWLAGVTPGWHLLTERIEEITERAFRYGRSGVHLWRHRLAPIVGPADLLALYRRTESGGHRNHRRFAEVAAPGLRAAFAAYDRLFDLAFVLGYLHELGEALDHPFVELDHAGLREAWKDIAVRAAAVAGDRWRTFAPDYSRLDAGVVTDDALVGDVQRSLARYAPLSGAPSPADATPLAAEPGPAAGPDQPAGVPDLDRLLASWRELGAGGARIDADTVDRQARAAGFGFRAACAAIERTAALRPAAPVR